MDSVIHLFLKLGRRHFVIVPIHAKYESDKRLRHLEGAASGRFREHIFAKKCSDLLALPESPESG